jgi:hypothetical protein
MVVEEAVETAAGAEIGEDRRFDGDTVEPERGGRVGLG